MSYCLVLSIFLFSSQYSLLLTDNENVVAAVRQFRRSLYAHRSVASLRCAVRFIDDAEQCSRRMTPQTCNTLPRYTASLSWTRARVCVVFACGRVIRSLLRWIGSLAGAYWWQQQPQQPQKQLPKHSLYIVTLWVKQFISALDSTNVTQQVSFPYTGFLFQLIVINISLILWTLLLLLICILTSTMHPSVSSSDHFPICWLSQSQTNDNDFSTKWYESDNKYLHMRRWDEIIITKMSEEI